MFIQFVIEHRQLVQSCNKIQPHLESVDTEHPLSFALITIIIEGNYYNIKT